MLRVFMLGNLWDTRPDHHRTSPIRGNLSEYPSNRVRRSKEQTLLLDIGVCSVSFRAVRHHIAGTESLTCGSRSMHLSTLGSQFLK